MKSFISLSKPFVFGICLTLFCAASATAQQQTPRALTESEMRAMEDLGSLVGRQAGDDAQAQSPEHQQGATEHSGGRVRIAGEWYDTDKITGGRDEPDRVDRAAAVKADGDMEDLRQLHDEVDEEIRAEGQSTARGSAYKSTHDSADTHQEGRQMVLDTNWDTTEQAFSDAHVGMIGEDTFPQCETTRTVIPGEKEVSVTDQEVCEKVVLAAGDENGVACVRDRHCEAMNDDVSGERTAELFVSQDITGNSCSRTSSVGTYRDDLSMTATGVLDITEEEGGLSCRRSVWPETTEIVTPNSQDASLNIDTQSPQLLCSRDIWPTSGTESLPNHIDTTVNVNNESGGLICTRTRTVSGGGSSPGSGQMMHEPMMAGTGCTNHVQLPIPAGATGIGVTVTSNHPGWEATLVNIIGNQIQYTFERPGLPTMQCESPGIGEVVSITWSYHAPNPLNWGVGDNGDCSAGGTANCPAEWSCTQTAPTTINGIPVTAADVQGLPALFPGASNTCVAGTKSKSCSGSPQTNNDISIAHLIPSGTTAIQNFNLSVQNPQSGVSVQVTQTPSAANGWLAKVRVTRTSWATQPANPNIRLSWNAIRPVTNTEVVDTGNCAASGTAQCPAQWSCTATAPTTINGITVTPAMAASHAPLFPGAANNCASADRRSVCSGSASQDTPVNISSRLPAGTTSLTSVAFSVLNPQSGVSVSMIQTPTLANGWVAIFRTTRSVFTTSHDQPMVRLSWNSHHDETTISVRDEGNCSDTGSPACPTAWECTHSATYTVNGIPVTAAMAATQAPLFPGASSSCVVGSLSRTCTGSSDAISGISIAVQLPPGTTEIRDFDWTWNNPDPNLTVVLIEAPSAANGWVARFRVTRHYGTPPPPGGGGGGGDPGGPGGGGDDQQQQSGGLFGAVLNSVIPVAHAQSGGVPERPEITLNWQVDSEERYQLVVEEDGDCDAAEEGGFCPLQWQCNATGPGTLDGQQVTIAMLEDRGPLYPGDEPPRCLAADLINTCDGDGSLYTEVDLSPDIPDYVTEIRSYQWVVSRPSDGVSITQVQAPTLENGWRAIFRTDRTDWMNLPPPPEVRLTWVMNGETYYECEIVDTGDCSVQPDEFCDTEWTCTREVDDPPAELTLVSLGSVTTTPMLFGNAFPGVPHSATATFPASLFPAGTVEVHNFRWQITNTTGSGVCNANVTGKPTPGNPHSNVTVINGGGSTGGGGGGDYWHEEHHVYYQLMFNFPKESVHYRLANAAFNFILPPAHAQGAGCGVYLQFQWENMGYEVPPDPDATGPYRPDIEGQPPLFPDDGGACTQAELGVDCEAIWVGEECYINSDGVEVCVNQPPSDVPDTCGELEADETCTLVREECTEGGMSSGGWCYVRSYLYECTRAFKVPDPTIHEETICTEGSSGIPTVCMDGSCREEEPETVVRDVLEPAARMMIIQHQMKDYKRINSSSIPPGGGGPGPGDPQVPIINP